MGNPAQYKWILFYYNSLPDMPPECSLFSPEIMHRDFFKCNPTNTGHYQYPKFETLSYDEGCHQKEVQHFLNKTDPNYIVFYTRHTDLMGNKQNKIVGYFKVGEKHTFKYEDKCKQGFYASESVLLPKDKCIPIGYKSRGVPVSWGNSKIKDTVSNELKKLINNQTDNITDKYQQETKGIMEKLMRESGTEEIINICNRCLVKKNCHWGTKGSQFMGEKLNELYKDKFTC
jgi:hypothetical protein